MFMNKMLLVSKKTPDGTGRLDYYLTQKKCSESGDFLFGVEIIKSTFDEYNVEYLQKREVQDLCGDRGRVGEFIYILSEKSVLPSALALIAQEYSAKNFFNCTKNFA